MQKQHLKKKKLWSYTLFYGIMLQYNYTIKYCIILINNVHSMGLGLDLV